MHAMMKLCALTALMGASASVFADVNFRARGGYTAGTYDLSAEYTSSSADLISEPYSGYALGVTAIISSWMYFDFSTSAASGNGTWKEIFDVELDRTDSTFSVGFRGNNFSYYLGYKVGNTEISFDDGDNITFDSAGFVVGAGYVIPMKSSALSLGYGVGLLEGELKDSDGTVYTADETFGFSLSGAFTYLFTKQFSVSAEYKWQSYEFFLTDKSTASPWYATEKLSGYTLSAAYSF